jgi:tRNA threonylcarbamoyladenosine biosynthesis protein TsaB
MLILAIDTSTRSRSLALLRDERILAQVSDTEQSPYSERLFRDVQALQREHSFQMREIDLYAVAAGPGSFTGLRVGLTAVKGWAEVYGKPIAAISALEAIAAQSEQQTGIAGAYFDAKRGQVFGAAYDLGLQRHMKLIGEELLAPAGDFLAHLKTVSGATPPILVSPSPETIPLASIALIFPGARIEKVSSALAPFIGRLGFMRAVRGELVDALTVDANYIRRSDAEVQRKGA